MSSNRRRFASLMIAAVAAVLLLTTPARAESTFDQIKRTGELRYGAIDYPPNWFRDKTTGKWQGFLVEMAEDVAKEMGVKAVPVETTLNSLTFCLISGCSTKALAVLIIWIRQVLPMKPLTRAIR